MFFMNISGIFSQDRNRKIRFDFINTFVMWRNVFMSKTWKVIKKNKYLTTFKIFEKWSDKWIPYFDTLVICLLEFIFVFLFSQLKVSLAESQSLEHFDIKEIEIEKVTSGELKRIYHLNYTTWPDHGVPSSPVPILQVICILMNIGR